MVVARLEIKQALAANLLGATIGALTGSPPIASAPVGAMKAPAAAIAARVAVVDVADPALAGLPVNVARTIDIARVLFGRLREECVVDLEEAWFRDSGIVLACVCHSFAFPFVPRRLLSPGCLLLLCMLCTI